MATSASGQKYPNTQSTNLLDNVTQLLTLLGGQKSTETQTTTANTGALQDVLTGLQGDQTAQQNALLESIFQQAGAKIPGLQAQLVNATGTRTANNGGMAAILQSLLQQTTVQAQQQIAAQNQRNQELQIQAAGRMAENTRTQQVTRTSGTNLKSGASKLATGTALLQLLASGKKLYNERDKAPGAPAGAPAGSMTSAPMASAPAQPMASAPITSTQAAALPTASFVGPDNSFAVAPNDWEQFIPDLTAQLAGGSETPNIGANDWEQFVPGTPVWRPEDLIWNQDNYDR